ncbi:hypothetical protein [Streptomyces vinaceus]|uniref:hypothetical protein n=1 Tax=Streptomyces vinaceus TaxID=1960 RepID=UPI0036D128F4
MIFHSPLDIAAVIRQHQAEDSIMESLDLTQISPFLTEHIMYFGKYSTHEVGITPDDYGAHLDVDSSVLGEDEAVAS